MLMGLGTNDILRSSFMHYTIVVSLEMSDEPQYIPKHLLLMI